MTWNKDHEKFKMAAILHQILFLFISRFIIDAGLCARIGPRAPAHYSTILIRGLLWIISTMLPEEKLGAIWVSAIF